MKKLARLEKIQKLIKVQEQKVFREFKEIQKNNAELKIQINDLAQHGQLSSNKLMQKSVSINEINLVRQFNGKIHLVLEQLNIQLADNEKKFLQTAEKIKEIRTRMRSIERLTDRHQQKHDYQQQKQAQRQLEENINYVFNSQD